MENGQNNGNISVTNLKGLVINDDGSLNVGQNIERTVYAPATTFMNGTNYTSDFDNPNCTGLKVFIKTTTIGTAVLTLTVQQKDPASGDYVDMLTTVGIATNVMTAIFIAPNAIASANLIATNVMPKTYRYKIVVSGIGNAVGSIGEVLIM